MDHKSYDRDRYVRRGKSLAIRRDGDVVASSCRKRPGQRLINRPYAYIKDQEICLLDIVYLGEKDRLSTFAKDMGVKWICY